MIYVFQHRIEVRYYRVTRQFQVGHICSIAHKQAFRDLNGPLFAKLVNMRECLAHSVEDAGWTTHMSNMMMIWFHMRSLSFAGQTLNRL